MRDSERLELVKKELRNTRRYLRALGEFSQRSYHLLIKQLNLKSPSLSSVGGTRMGQSNFDLLDYSEQIEILEELKKLYSQKIDWNMQLTENAYSRTRNLIFAVYVNGMSYTKAQEIFGVSERVLRTDIDSYLLETVSWDMLNNTLEFTGKIEQLCKTLEQIEQKRGE